MPVGPYLQCTCPQALRLAGLLGAGLLLMARPFALGLEPAALLLQQARALRGDLRRPGRATALTFRRTSRGPFAKSGLHPNDTKNGSARDQCPPAHGSAQERAGLTLAGLPPAREPSPAVGRGMGAPSGRGYWKPREATLPQVRMVTRDTDDSAFPAKIFTIFEGTSKMVKIQRMIHGAGAHRARGQVA